MLNLRPTPFMRLRSLRALACGAAMVSALASSPALAWDVATTHLDLSEAALLSSNAHRAWMDLTGMRTGLFSQLSVPLDLLSPIERWELDQAIQKSPGRAMARPTGGEPLCRPDEKDKARAQCLEHRPWVQGAMAWMRLGVIVAARSPHLLAGHMALPMPGEDTQQPAWFRSAQRRHNHAPLPMTITGAAPVLENGPKALLAKRHGWSLRNLSAQMVASVIASSPKARELAMAKSMVLWGVALHLLQNQTLPAIARGELAGLFEPLSRRPADKGSALAQWARAHKSRADFDALAKDANLPELLEDPQSWDAAFLRNAKVPSLVRWVARHFISPAVFPKQKRIAWDADPQQAVNELFAGQDLHLRAVEREGLTLKGWPAAAGYLTTASGRALAAYQRNEDGEVHLYEDEAVMAENAEQLLGLAMASSKQLLNRAFTLPPDGVSDPSQSKTWRKDWTQPQALMLREDAQGTRHIVARWQTLPSDTEILAQQKAASADGMPIFVVYEAQGRRLPKLLAWRLPPIQG